MGIVSIMKIVYPLDKTHETNRPIRGAHFASNPSEYQF